jgi:hypothetical protein
VPSSAIALASSALALVLLTFLVGLRLLYCRVREMRSKRIHPQAASTSIQVAARLEDVRASDNFRNLFEVPVLFYALVATALAAGHTPGWLAAGAWGFVALRVIHSTIQCTYNKVFHRLSAFLAAFFLVVVLWVALVVSLFTRSAA